MYSGSDSTESANYGQWPLNPAFFQNMPNEQVDWAALAQQWIQMKEAGPPIPEPKQTNNISEVKEVPQTAKEVILPVAEENIPNSGWNSTTNSIESYDSSWNWKTQQNWEWGNPAWNPHINTPPSAIPPAKPPLLPIAKGYTSVEGPKENSTIPAGYTSVKSSKFSASYAGQSSQNHSRTYKPHNRRYSKVNVPKTNTPSPVDIPQVPEIESSLDANKRKQLPAWIREGLEKMEKEKLKQIEREREKEKQTLFSEKIKEHEKEAMEILKDTINERRKSKFDSDDEQSQPEEKEEPEQLDHDQLIILVRRTMTEILLKVTNEAIHSICTEERQRYMTKTQTTGKVTGRTNVKAKLGLGMYGSDSGSESDNSDTSTKNSDDELKNSIKKKKAEFVQTEKGIEDKLQQAEKEKDNKKTKDESSENHVEEYTPEMKKEDGNSKTNSNSRYRRSSSRSTEDSNDKWSYRRSSSRESSSGIKRRRDRSRGRRYTPEKRKKQSNRSRSRSYERRTSSDSKYRKDRKCSDRSRRSRSRTSRSSRRSRSRSSSYKSRRSSDRSSRSKRKRSRSPRYSRSSRRSRSRSHARSSRR